MIKVCPFCYRKFNKPTKFCTKQCYLIHASLNYISRYTERSDRFPIKDFGNDSPLNPPAGDLKKMKGDGHEETENILVLLGSEEEPVR